MINSIFVIIGSIIGAGFASGKEIFTFFNLYGFFGFIGLILSEIVIGLVLFKVFNILINSNVASYSDFISKVIHKSKFVNSIICNIINIFLLISFIIMVAGFSAYFAQELNMPYIFGSIIICTLSFITFLDNIDGIIKINKYLIPFLIFIILFVGINNWDCFTVLKYPATNFSFNWLISSLLYSSYNLMMVIPILISLKKYIYNTNQAKIVAFSVVLFLLIMAIIIFILLNYHFADIENLELPFVHIASQTGNIYKYVCGIAILIAIFTTAISSGYSFLNNLNIKSKKTYTFVSLLICLAAICLGNIGFGVLLNLLYPILGVLGLIQILLICKFK